MSQNDMPDLGGRVRNLLLEILPAYPRMVQDAQQRYEEAVIKFARTEREIALRRIAKGLVPLYRTSQAETARLCDEDLDPTGNLLGWLREEAARPLGEDK